MLDENIRRRTVFTAAAGVAAIAAASVLSSSRAIAQQSPAAVDVPSEVDASIRSLLDERAEPEVKYLRASPAGTSMYYVAELVEPEGGEPIMVRQPGVGEPVVLADFVGLPSIPVNQNGFDAVRGVNIASFKPDPAGESVDVEFPPFVEAATAAQDKLIFLEAKKAADEQMSSATAPGTNSGRLACAWAVNRVVERALLAKIGGGLATANMVKVLRARPVKISAASPVPGSIIISPTVYSPKVNIGHVGIVGEDGKIYSNSSSRRRWEQNFDLTSWNKHYRDKKGLEVLVFRLDDIYFPESSQRK